jgi:hypothetical protein
VADEPTSDHDEPPADGDAGEAMHVHRPKPLHGLKEMAVEIGIIVIGVIIALAAEQAVEWVHWQEKVEHGRHEIHREIADNSAFNNFRATVEPCVARRLTELSAITEAIAAHQKVAPVHFAGLHIGFLVSSDTWEAERAEQTLTHLPRSEQDGLTAFYAQQADIKVWVEKEESSWATLRMLEGDPNRLGPADVSLLRNALQQSRNFNFLISLNSREQMDRARKLGVAIPPPPKGYVARACEALDRTANPNPMGEP